MYVCINVKNECTYVCMYEMYVCMSVSNVCMYVSNVMYVKYAM